MQLHGEKGVGPDEQRDISINQPEKSQRKLWRRHVPLLNSTRDSEFKMHEIRLTSQYWHEPDIYTEW